MITKEKWQKLKERMTELGIEERDLQERFVLGSGSGGQKLHKSSSCVHLKHLPSSISIKCQDDRLRQVNRYKARQRLCDKIEMITLKEKSQEQQRIAKIRQQKKRRSRRTKQKILDDKQHTATLKKNRQKPDAQS